MKVAGVIPARMASTRFPGKPLANIAGLSMIEHVYRRARMNPKFSEICIATCDEEIATTATGFGCRAIMTSAAHQRGTDRVAEAAGHVDADIVVNVQGDEPLIRPEVFDALLAPFETEPGTVCTNLMVCLNSTEEQDSLNNVKVVVDRRGRAMYFSREPIPSRRMGVRPVEVFRQIGIYAFTKPFLMTFFNLPATPCEAAESCDMLRIVEHGYPIRMIATDIHLQSVDTAADLDEAERLMRRDDLAARYLEAR